MSEFRPRKILFLHSSSDLYGASKILLTLVNALIERGHVPVVVLSESGPLALALKKLGVKVHFIKLGILRRKYFNLPGIINRLLVTFKAQKRLKEIVSAESIDTIYSNTTGVLVGAWVASRMNIRHIWHIHEITVNPKWFVRFTGFLVNKYSNHVIVVSKAVKSHWLHYIDEDKIEIVYNGIDYSSYLTDKTDLRRELSLGDDAVLIGMVGRVHFWKGQDYFLKMAKELEEVDSRIVFIMVGDVFPGYEGLSVQIDELKRDLGLTEKVYNLGFREDIGNVMNALDIFVLPSTNPDPLPTVILEAMASGRPVVATNHGGAIEMVLDNKTGLLIPWDDEVAASEKIKPIILNKELRIQMGEKGRMRVLNNFSLSHFGRRISEIVEHCD